MVSGMLVLEEAAGKALSVTANVKLAAGAAAVGVPLITPVSEYKVSPGGNARVTDHFSGGLQPASCKVIGG